LTLLKIIISFPFIDQKSIYGFTQSYWTNFVGFGKDAYYRLKNNPKINWRSLLFGLLLQYLKATDKEQTGKRDTFKNIKAFIFDDTTIRKTGYKIEGVSMVWNHVLQKAVLGYQLLVMGLYDGSIFIPVNFSFHREKGRNKKYRFGLKPKLYKKQYRKKREPKTQGAKRKKELDLSKIKSAVNMITYAVKKGISADYVLTDSWFTCWELVKTSLDNKLKFIGMFSKSKTLFTFNNKQLTYKSIRKLQRKKIKRNKKFNLYYIRTVVQWHGQDIVLIFTRKGKNGNWKTLISTDLSLNFNKTIEVYQIRWSIEVFFKETKQLLDLGKEKSNDFDAQIADTTIIMIRYIFLALRKRIDHYDSYGKLFKNTKAQLLEQSLHERLIALLIAIIEVVTSIFEEVDEEKIISKIIKDPSVLEKLKPLLIYEKNTA